MTYYLFWALMTLGMMLNVNLVAWMFLKHGKEEPMPLKSKSQERALWAKDPRVAKKFESETTPSQRARLPEKKKKAKK